MKISETLPVTFDDDLLAVADARGDARAIILRRCHFDRTPFRAVSGENKDDVLIFYAA